MHPDLETQPSQVQPDPSPLVPAQPTQALNNSVSSSPSPTDSHAIAVDTVLSGVILALPILAGLAILVHRKRRGLVTRQRIEKLERIWQLDCKETTS